MLKQESEFTRRFETVEGKKKDFKVYRNNELEKHFILNAFKKWNSKMKKKTRTDQEIPRFSGFS